MRKRRSTKKAPVNEIAELDRMLEALRAKVGEEALQAALRAKVSMGARSIGTGGDVKGSLLNTGAIEVNVYRGPPAENPKEALTIYRKVVVASCCDVPLHAIDPSSGDASSPAHKLDLASIYQGLDTKTHVKDKHIRTRALEEARALRAIEAAATTPRLVLLGDPGSGKSTFVSHLARCLAASALEPKAGWLKRLGWPNAKGPLPILIILRDFARWMPTDADANEPNLLRRFLAVRLQAQGLGFAEEPILASLDDGTAMVLFDGLDEVPSREQRAEVRKAVEAFLKRHENCRALITCRVLSYEEREAQLRGVPSFTLAPFDDEKIQAFIQAWYEELGRRNVVERGSVDELAKQLAGAIQKPDLRRLAPNPLLLTVMALLHANRGRLPEARALLYKETVELLLWHREAHKTGRLRALLDEAKLGEVDLKQVLWKLAFEAHQATVEQESKKQENERDHDAVAGIPEAALEKALYAIHPTKDRNWAHATVEAMKIRAGLLLERAPEIYSFPHRTFQEYLAGVHLSNHNGFAHKAATLLGEGPLWREVVLLSVGRLVHDGDTDRPLALVGELCPERPREDKAGWANAAFAGEVLTEMGIHRAEQSQLGQDLLERVRARLLGIMTGEAPSAVERARAGEVLGWLGDPRFDRAMWCLPKEGLRGFEEIPAGNFWMGDGREQHEVWVERCFMARYPVTVEQFAAYVKESGETPRDMDSLRGSPNHPVAWISWGEAMGYAEWLTERLKESPRTPEPLKTLLTKGDEQGRRWRVTLPSDAEWEKAARGGDDKRIYPWGDEEGTNRANCYETGIGGTSAVGCFAGGKSPYGCEEMSGNVWEWTRNLWYKKGVDEAFGYPYDAKDGRESIQDLPDEPCVVRGGSFFEAMEHARCAVRNPNLPNDQAMDSGFRVVVSPIS